MCYMRQRMLCRLYYLVWLLAEKVTVDLSVVPPQKWSPWTIHGTVDGPHSTIYSRILGPPGPSVTL